MNVKFRMPKLSAKQTTNQGGNVKSRSIVKELLLTTIATTISIVLTFGTAAWLEKKEAEKSRRLMAMTIINDIDQSLDVVRKRMEFEEKSHGIACYVIENRNRLDSIGLDTLDMFINYVTSAYFNSNLEFNTMNENIFNSSQDSWRTLNDRKFLNNVQEFYNARAVLEQQYKDWIFFKKPLTKEEEYEMFMEGQCGNNVDMCRWLLDCKRLKSYLDYVSIRINAYLSFLQLTNLNEENKFLMNITEQEMEEFVNQTYLEIHVAKEKDLTGTWNAVLDVNDDKCELAYEFRKDHTFTMHHSIGLGHHMFRDKMVQRYTLSGTWAVEADSLVMRYDMQSYKMEVDDSQISYPPHLAETIRAMKEEVEAMKPMLVRRLEQNNRMAYATNLDKSGTRLELTEAGNPPVHYRRRTRK